MSLSVAILLFSGCGKAPEPVEDGSIGIHLADWVPAMGHNGWWGVVLAGRPVGEKVGSAEDLQAIAVAPGRYDVYWIQDYNHENDPMRLAADVLVEPGKATALAVDSGIRLESAEPVPEIGHNGWWGAVPAGLAIDERVDWSSSGSQPLLLPPGNYDLYWRENYNADPRRIAEAIEVTPGQLSVVPAEFPST